MRVLIWTQYFWPETFHINEVASELAKQGTEVTILTGKPNYPEGRLFNGYRTINVDRESFAGCEVYRIPMKIRGSGSAKDLVFNYLSFIASGYLIAPLVLRKKKFDIIFVYAPSPLLQALPAIFIAWLKKTRLTLWVQDLWPDALKATGFVKNRWILQIVEYAVRYIYRYSDLILIQSKQFLEPVERLAQGREKIRFFPNSAEDMTYVGSSQAPLQGRRSYDIERYFSVVFAGNIGSIQSCETIIAAAELLRDYPAIKFYIVGSGSASVNISISIERLKLTNVIMTGRLPPEEMPAIFAAASALLVSLKRDPALLVTVPSKLQSYMSAGKPIIASLEGEAARLVDEAGAGIVCPAEDAEALARAVRRLHQMPSWERLRLGINARAYFEANFNIKKAARELLDHLGSVAFQKEGTEV